MDNRDSDYIEMIKFLEESQEAEYDNRQRVREAEHFLHKRDGQWEPEILSRFSGKPKYTFDECNPIVDDIMGEMQVAEFGIRITSYNVCYTKLLRFIERVLRLARKS